MRAFRTSIMRFCRDFSKTPMSADRTALVNLFGSAMTVPVFPYTAALIVPENSEYDPLLGMDT